MNSCNKKMCTYPVYGHRLLSSLTIFKPYNIEGYPTIELQESSKYGSCYSSGPTIHGGRKLIYHADIPFEKLNYLQDMWALEIEGVVTLVWNPLKQCVAYIKGALFTQERLHFWLLHTFLPLVLMFQGRYHLLHAAAVEIEEGKAILLLAPPQGGKSILTHAMITKGYRFLGDDVVALHKDEDLYKIIPSYPYCRTRRVSESLGECYCDSYVNRPLTLVGAFCLNLLHNHQEVEIRLLKGLEKFNVFRRSIFSPISHMKRVHFQVECDMANSVPVYSIKGKMKKEYLQLIMDTISDIIE